MQQEKHWQTHIDDLIAARMLRTALQQKLLTTVYVWRRADPSGSMCPDPEDEHATAR
jgi:hypothetical protein